MAPHQGLGTNPYARVVLEPVNGIHVSERQVHATLAVAEEQRTATLVALLSVPGLDHDLHQRVLAEVTARLGLDPAQ